MKAGKLLITIGLVILIFSAFFFYQRYNPLRLSFSISDYRAQGITDSASMPVEIIIPAIKLDLSIIPAKLVKNSWETTDKGVSYLISSPIPGNIGNSILYGHDWANILGPITKLKTGQIIEIKFVTGAIKKFEINTISLVSPDQASILAPSGDARITLYTCTGFWDSKRFVVTAILKGN
jgi:LPXTG-site transpeptidase (sortase) family protein